MKLGVDTFALILLLACFTAQLPETIAASYAVGAIFILIRVSKVSLRRVHFSFYFLTTLALLPPVLTFNHGGTPLFYLFASPFLLLFAYYFAGNSLDHIRRVLRSVYWIFVFFVAVALVLLWDEPEPFGAVLPWASTNGIPSYLIVVQIAYSIAFYLENNRLPLLSSSVTLVVAVFGLGRGSMIIGALILASSLLINLLVLKSKRDRSIALKVALLAVIPFFIFLSDKAQQIGNEIEVLIEGSKFASGVLDEHRGRIIGDYVNKIDEINLILGASYDGTSINEYYGGNPHNSFIRAHSFYGLAALVALFVPLVLVLMSRADFVQKFVVSTLVSMALLRAATEPIFFPSTLDFFYFLYFALFFRFARSRSKPRLVNAYVN